MGEITPDTTLAFFEQLGFGVYRSTPDGRLLYINDSLAFMLGFASAAELLERGVSDDDYHSDTPRSVFVHRIEQDGHVRGLLARWKHRDGSWFPIREAARAVKGPDGRTEYYEGYVEDMSELARAEAALDAREAHLRTLVQHSPLGIAIEVPGEGFVEVNPAFCALLGRSREALLGATASDVSFAGDWEALAPLFAEVHAGSRDTVTLERRYRRPDGSAVWCQTSVSAVRERGAHAYSIVMLDDVTERKRLESSARQSQKLDALGRLAGGIAHDFNNLLTAIAGHAAFARRETRDGRPATEEFEQIEAACDRASALTRRLLTVGKTQMRRTQPLELGPQLLELEAMLRRVIPDNIVLETKVTPGVHTVVADPTQLEQVVLNLVLNARDAMPQGGRIQLEVGDLHLARAEAESLELTAGHYVRLAVRDTGTGISADVQARLFEPFFTTKPAGHGSGLGLATAYGIARQSGGAIRVESAEGAGSCFELLLPRRAQTATRTKARRRDTPDPSLTHERVLVVEDESSLRTLMERILQRAGYAVTSATDGAAAWELLSASTEPPDLLVTDVVMPKLRGTALAARARERFPGLRVLYVSGFVGDDDDEAEIRASGTPLLHKPFSPSEFEEAVRVCLDVVS